LKGKLPEAYSEEASPVEDLVGALANMGFDKKAAREAVVRCAKEVDGMKLENDEREKEIFRRSLASVSKEGKKR
jgi:Holliday junction resolvasome RuvABC DNA-binding subunit